MDPRPEEASIATPGSILVSAAASVYISREHGRLRTTRHFVLWLLLGRQLEGSIFVSGLVLEWTLGLKRLAYSRIDLSLCCSVSLHLKGTWETQNHQTFCVSLVLVSFTLIYRAACSLLVKHSTIITSEERASEIPSYQLLGT